MASSHSSLVFFFLAFLLCAANAQSSITLPIRKDPKTSQFFTTIQMGSNRAKINSVLNLGGQFLWFECNNYTSSTYAPIPCGSSKCAVAKGSGCVSCNLPPRPGCSTDTCSSSAYNPFQDVLVAEEYGEDTFYPTRKTAVPKLLFSCMDTGYIGGLAKGAKGMLGLARSNISFHKQVAGNFKLPDKFSICLPSDPALGKLTIGGTRSNISKSIKTTPLIINPVSTAPIYSEGDPSDEYFIGVTAIKINGVPVSVKSSYFSFDKNGVGGTKLSTIQNYTSLHSSIYRPLTRAFVKAASDMKIKRVAAVSPFRACFESKSIFISPSGPKVPSIDLVLPGKDVYWRIDGGNAMVAVDEKTTCLALVDAGKEPRTSIVIGVHQLEERYLEFDLGSSQLKFSSSSLLVENKSCSRI